MRQVLDGAHTHLEAKGVTMGISFSLDGVAPTSAELNSVMEKLKTMMTAQNWVELTRVQDAGRNRANVVTDQVYLRHDWHEISLELPDRRVLMVFWRT